MKSTHHDQVLMLPIQATLSAQQLDPEPLMVEWSGADFTVVDCEEIFPLDLLEPAERHAFVCPVCRQGEVRRCETAYQQSMTVWQRSGTMINLRA